MSRWRAEMHPVLYIASLIAPYLIYVIACVFVEIDEHNYTLSIAAFLAAYFLFMYYAHPGRSRIAFWLWVILFPALVIFDVIVNFKGIADEHPTVIAITCLTFVAVWFFLGRSLKPQH